MKSNTDLTGAGPFQFSAGALATGESFLLPLDELEKGRYKKYMPFDSARFVNSSTETVEATINGIYDTKIPPNSVVNWDNQGVVSINVTNAGGGSIDSGDLTIEVKKEPYDSDEAARESKGKSWLQRAVDDVVPGGVPGGK